MSIFKNLITCTAPELKPDPLQTFPAKSFITHELKQGEEEATDGSGKM
jgi:hypothetical protein